MLEDEQLDRLINRHLSKQLDPHLGRAAFKFEADVLNSPLRQSVWRRRFIGLATAAAACFALAWGWKALHHSVQKIASNSPLQLPITEQPPELVPVSESLAWRTIDDGIIGVEDDVPIRQLRNQVLQYVEWYDPQRKATVEMTVPREQIIYVALNSH